MTTKRKRYNELKLKKQASRSVKFAKWLMVFLAVTMLFSTFAGYVVKR